MAFLPPRWLCNSCDIRQKAIAPSFTSQVFPWVIALQKACYDKVKPAAASNVEAVLDIVPLTLYRALCRYVRTLPGGNQLPDKALQLKGLDGG